MKRQTLSLIPVLASAFLLASCGASGDGASRDSVRAVGSSTVYPFAKAVAEQFARSQPEFKSPIIESTGTGGGISLFCKGVGANTPDIANASRRMHDDEFAACQANGVTEVVEIQIGYDGLALASARNGIAMNLSPELVYRALAARPFGKEQTARTWRDVDPSLPDQPILVYGPPTTSGTRDSFAELILTVGCDTDPAMAALKDSNEEEHEKVCTEVRSDGAYVDQGEQDNLIVQKIEGNPNAVGVFGYSYLEENLEELKGLPMNGVEPTYDSIASGQYPGARAMFIYVKKAHLDAIPGLREFVLEWVNAGVRGGPLTAIGLVANSDEVAARSRTAATQFPTLTAADLN
ncbi:MAG: phosphate ABC transporter substrate-binding protein [Sphingomonadales bacterium 32-68-7]|nr:MAG: phosphate ABC transporter substrate-binding protein [Sphingomonadales bacterium 12-68-11]OYX07999.1 MAG: phosphate ABC transporter substrate-binding protein [Sphingomonadales bacterium 32-68-7]